VIYCCYLTVAESAGMPQLILNLKRQFYHINVCYFSTFLVNWA